MTSATDAHPSGLPYVPGMPPCGACGWARPDGGRIRCIAAGTHDDDGPTFAPDTLGCAWWEPTPICEPCGACCREAFDSVEVKATDRRTLTNQAARVVTHDDGWRDLVRVPSPTGTGTRCGSLVGDGDAAPFRCTMYADRPSACADLERGSWNCLFARRRVGLSPG